jgi:hypothetical protein
MYGQPNGFKSGIDTFSKPIPLNDIRDIIGEQEYRIFDEEMYIKGIFQSDEITLPKKLTMERELDRFKNRIGYQSFGVIHSGDPSGKGKEPVVQEQAEINFFSMVNPNHIRYHQNRFQPSQQFVVVIKNLIAGLRKCDTLDDVKEFLNDKHNHVNPDDYTCMVLPSILARVFQNDKMFTNRLFNEKNLKKYMDSYDSIIKQDKSVRRFKDYDLFSTFKADKEGTIQFLEDFLSLKLVSDPKAYISNHTLLVLFNIFDSRIYLDILYNVLPNSEKKDEFETEDGFVKAIRARINENSNKSSPYSKPSKSDTLSTGTIPTSSEVVEYAREMMNSLGDIEPEDYPYLKNIICEACRLESLAVNDYAFNHKMDESHFLPYVMEYNGDRYVFSGEVPAYMKGRITTTDAQGKPDVKIEDSPLPEGIPTNDITDLINSIEDRADEVQPDENGNMDIRDGFGKEANINPRDKGNQVVYNITYNYNNSNNTTTTTSHDSHDTRHRYVDHSTNKTTGGTSNNRYLKSNIRQYPNRQPTNRGSNNYNNDTSSYNTNDENSQIQPMDNTTFSTGKSVQEVFAMLSSKEPQLFEESGTRRQIIGSAINAVGSGTGIFPDMNPEPEQDALTRAQDFDRKMLEKNAKLEEKVRYGTNTMAALKRPFERTKDWVEKWAQELVQKDANETKSKIMKDPSYRRTLKNVFKTALDLELLSAAYIISPFIGVMATADFIQMKGNQYDYKREVQNELMTEISIIDDKIRKANANKDYDAKYQLIRIRRQLLDKATKVTRDPIAKIKPLRNHSHIDYDFD